MSIESSKKELSNPNNYETYSIDDLEVEKFLSFVETQKNLYQDFIEFFTI